MGHEFTWGSSLLSSVKIMETLIGMCSHILSSLCVTLLVPHTHKQHRATQLISVPNVPDAVCNNAWCGCVNVFTSSTELRQDTTLLLEDFNVYCEIEEKTAACQVLNSHA